jgi:hypothetical protein
LIRPSSAALFSASEASDAYSGAGIRPTIMISSRSMVTSGSPSNHPDGSRPVNQPRTRSFLPPVLM